jgi:hypothetical protein
MPRKLKHPRPPERPALPTTPAAIKQAEHAAVSAFVRLPPSSRWRVMQKLRTTFCVSRVRVVREQIDDDFDELLWKDVL